MSAEFLPPTGPAVPAMNANTVAPDGNAAEALKKKKNKVRAAWISFVGRILAQCLGAVATVALGLMFLQRYQATSNASASEAAIAASTTPPAPRVRVRHPGEAWLAVLPFENYSPDQMDGPVNAMTETLIASLSQVKGLRVVSRTSSVHYGETKRRLPEVARELGVDWVVEGSIFQVDRRVRVISQLIDARTDEHAWAETYDRPVEDILTLHAGLASSITKSVDIALHERERRLALLGALEPTAAVSATTPLTEHWGSAVQSTTPDESAVWGID